MVEYVKSCHLPTQKGEKEKIKRTGKSPSFFLFKKIQGDWGNPKNALWVYIQNPSGFSYIQRPNWLFFLRDIKMRCCNTEL